MTKLITDEQRTQPLANGRETTETPIPPNAVGQAIQAAPREARVERIGHVCCRLKRMHISPLYEQAVDLSPRAARIAAALLVNEATLPEPLRRSLAIALSACGGSAHGDEMPTGGPAGLNSEDREARAAARFVKACKTVCARG